MAMLVVGIDGRFATVTWKCRRGGYSLDPEFAWHATRVQAEAAADALRKDEHQVCVVDLAAKPAEPRLDVDDLVSLIDGRVADFDTEYRAARSRSGGRLKAEARAVRFPVVTRPFRLPALSGQGALTGVATSPTIVLPAAGALSATVYAKVAVAVELSGQGCLSDAGRPRKAKVPQPKTKERRQHTGTIYKMRARWVAAVSRGPRGATQRTIRYAATHAEAEQALTEILKEFNEQQ